MTLAGPLDSLYALYRTNGLELPQVGVYLRCADLNGIEVAHEGDRTTVRFRQAVQIDPIRPLFDAWADGYLDSADILREAEHYTVTLSGRVRLLKLGTVRKDWTFKVPRGVA